MLWAYNERGSFIKKTFKILITFCHWLSEIYKKKKERGGPMHAVPNNWNLLYWDSLGYTTLCHGPNDRKWSRNEAETAPSLISYVAKLLR